MRGRGSSFFFFLTFSVLYGHYAPYEGFPAFSVLFTAITSLWSHLDKKDGLGVRHARGCNGKGTSENKSLRHIVHTMDLLWEKFQWILPLYMKPISFQSKASVVCSVTAAIFIDFCLKKLNVFPNILVKNKQTNIWIPQNKSPGIEMLINFLC